MAFDSINSLVSLCSGGDHLVQPGEAVNVRLDGELRTRGSDAAAERGDVDGRQLPDEVLEAREAQTEAAVAKQPHERAVLQRQHGQAAAEILVGLVREAGVEVRAVECRVEAGPAEVVLRQLSKKPRPWKRRVHAQAGQFGRELGVRGHMT